MSKLRFSTNDYQAIAEFILEVGGVAVTDDNIQEVQDALNDFDALDGLVFLEEA